MSQPLQGGVSDADAVYGPPSAAGEAIGASTRARRVADAGGVRGSFAALVALVRPRHWVKNAFVAAPLLFSGEFMRPRAIARELSAVALFCIAASAVYVLNDLRDAEADRRHPTKRFSRPIAAGAVTTRQAQWLLGLLLAALAVGCAAIWPAGQIALVYLAVNVAYTLRLKHVPVVDLFCLASGFALRVLAGAEAIAVPLSSWMLITTLCLALYLAVIKRRQELIRSGDEGRALLAQYTRPLLDRYAEVSAIGAIVFYGLFVATVRPELKVTVPLVLFGLFRYWYLVERNGDGESPTDTVIADLPLLLTVLAWGVACGVALLMH